MEKLKTLIERFGGDKVRVCSNEGCGKAFTKDFHTCPLCKSELRLAKELPAPELESYKSLGD